MGNNGSGTCRLRKRGYGKQWGAKMYRARERPCFQGDWGLTEIYFFATNRADYRIWWKKRRHVAGGNGIAALHCISSAMTYIFRIRSIRLFLFACFLFFQRESKGVYVFTSAMTGPEDMNAPSPKIITHNIVSDCLAVRWHGGRIYFIFQILNLLRPGMDELLLAPEILRALVL